MLHLEAPLYLKYFQHEKSLPEFEPKENKRFSEASKKDNIWFGKENEKPNCQRRQTFFYKISQQAFSCHFHTKLV